MSRRQPPTTDEAGVSNEPLTLDFGDPSRWWVATRADVAWLYDPDDWDHPKRQHHDGARYDVMTTVLNRVSARLGSASTDDPITIEVTPSEVHLLGPVGVRLLRTWPHDDPPTYDPWSSLDRRAITYGGSTRVSQGRHRSWCAWRADPTALLPIRSLHLANVRELASPEYASGYMDRTRRALAEHIAGTELATRAPRFEAAMQRIALDGTDPYAHGGWPGLQT
jgi:hypothetical protein